MIVSMSHLGSYLNQVSLWLILLGLTLTELGLPLPETVFVVATGVAAQQRGLGIVVAVASSCLAVLLGDILLYQLARRYGAPAFKRWPLCLVLPTRVLPRIDALIERHGAMAVFVARFLTGVRGAMFVLVGMRRMPFSRFLLWDGLAVLVTVPVFAVLGFVCATNVPLLEAHVDRANGYMLALLAAVVLAYGVLLALRWNRARRALSSGNG